MSDGARNSGAEPEADDDRREADADERGSDSERVEADIDRREPDTDSGDWRARLESAGELTPDAVAAILAAHGDRGSSAIEAVGEGRVKQYQDFPVVVGHSDEYIVEDGACTCKDATYNLDPEDPSALCWHALAVEIARRVGAVDEHDMYYTEVRDLL